MSEVTELISISVFIKGGVQSGCPQPQVIIPSAAYGGAIISFVLCPSELVKVCYFFFPWFVWFISERQSSRSTRGPLYLRII